MQKWAIGKPRSKKYKLSKLRAQQQGRIEMAVMVDNNTLKLIQGPNQFSDRQISIGNIQYMQAVEKSSFKVDASLQVLNSHKMIALNSSQVATSHSLLFWSKELSISRQYCTNKVPQRIYFINLTSFSIQISVVVFWSECTPFKYNLYFYWYICQHIGRKISFYFWFNPKIDKWGFKKITCIFKTIQLCSFLKWEIQFLSVSIQVSQHCKAFLYTK